MLGVAVLGVFWVEMLRGHCGGDEAAGVVGALGCVLDSRRGRGGRTWRGAWNPGIGVFGM